MNNEDKNTTKEKTKKDTEKSELTSNRVTMATKKSETMEIN